MQKQSFTPRERLDQGMQNVRYRDRIRRVFEYMLPLKSMQKRLQRVKGRSQKRINDREFSVFVYARA